MRRGGALLSLVLLTGCATGPSLENQIGRAHV